MTYSCARLFMFMLGSGAKSHHTALRCAKRSKSANEYAPERVNFQAEHSSFVGITTVLLFFLSEAIFFVEQEHFSVVWGTNLPAARRKKLKKSYLV